MRSEVRVLMCEPLYEEARRALPPGLAPELVVELLARPCECPTAAQEALVDAATQTIPLGVGASILVGGGCLAGLGATHNRHSRLHVLTENTCFELIADPDRVTELLDSRAFLVTPGWVARWPTRMRSLGITAELAPMIFAESASRVVLLDTGTVPDVMSHVAAFARFVELPHERVEVGLDHLRAKLLTAAWGTRNRELSELREQLAHARRRAADAHAIAELSRRASTSLDEGEIVATLLEITRDLTGADRVVWIPITHDVPGGPIALPEGPIPAPILTTILAAETEPAVGPEGELCIRIVGPDGTLGVLGVTGLAFPESAARYLALLGPLTQAVQPILGNARSLHGMIRLCAWCRKVGEADGSWRTLEAYIHDHTRAMFTHGICPSCSNELENGTSDVEPLA